jgi:hypothetical protein
LKPAWGKNFKRSYLKKSLYKKKGGAGRVAQGIGPDFNPQYYHKKKNPQNSFDMHS